MSTNLAAMFKTPSRILIAIAALGLACCSTSVEMPKGTSKGYTSARLIQRDPNGPAVTGATEKQVHGMLQNSISKQFASKGMAYGNANADLVVAYMVIYQEPGMTSSYETDFGYGRDAGRISDLAHTRGALENQRPDYFRQAGVIIDVIDSRTNKLVYRNFSKGDVIKSASSGTRAARIDAAVAQALAPFFGGN
jgi:hypothetical protein